MKKKVFIFLFLLLGAFAKILEHNIKLKVNEVKTLLTTTSEARFNIECPLGHNCDLYCPIVKMKMSYMCLDERFVVSRSDTKDLYGAHIHCGNRYHVRHRSTGNKMFIEFRSRNAPSKGTKYNCTLKSIPVPGPRKYNVPFVLDKDKECECGKTVNPTSYPNNQYARYVAKNPIVLLTGTNKMKCVGTIYHGHYIMTTASCLQIIGFNNSVVVQGDPSNPRTANQRREFRVWIKPWHHDYGYLRWQNKLSDSEVKREVSNAYQYRDYDIAIFVMGIPEFQQFAEVQQPLCLPFKYEKWNFEGMQVSSVDWKSEKSSVITDYKMNPPKTYGQNLIKIKHNLTDYYGAPLIYYDQQTGRRTILGIKVTDTEYLKIENMLEFLTLNSKYDLCKSV